MGPNFLGVGWDFSGIIVTKDRKSRKIGKNCENCKITEELIFSDFLLVAMAAKISSHQGKFCSLANQKREGSWERTV